jgi:toxin YoeB
MEGLKFTSEALADLAYWKKSGNTTILKRIRQLLEAIKRTPFEGIGKRNL